MDKTLFEAVKLGPIPSLEIEMALANGDWDSIKAMGLTTNDPEDFYEILKTHTFNASFVMGSRQKRAGLEFNSTFHLWPLLVDADLADQIENDFLGTKDTLLREIGTDIARLVGGGTVIGIPTMFHYGFIAGQNPAYMRKLLTNLSGDGASDDRLNESGYALALPVDAPRLGFIAFSIGTVNGWPALPHTQALLDIKEKLQGLLRLCANRHSAHIPGRMLIGALDSADIAIEQGLSAWIETLNDKYGISKWDVMFDVDDVVTLILELTEADVPLIAVPLRSYQIGTKGIARILEFVASMSRFGNRRAPN